MTSRTTGVGPTIGYQWQSAPAGSSTFTAIPGATSASHTTPILALADSGTQFRVAMLAGDASKTSDAATLTVIPDKVAPRPVEVTSVIANRTVVTLTFDGPIGYYRFEETAGQKTKNYGSAGAAADGLYMIGNGPDDSVPADVAVDSGPQPSEFLGFDPNNRAVIMDGLNTMLWINTQKQFLNNLTAFSLEYWVKPSNRLSDPGSFGTRIGLVGQNDAVEFGFIDNNTIQIWSSGGGSLDTDYNFSDNEWHHIATIADGRNIKNYFDGKLVGTGGTTTWTDVGTANPASVTIGTGNSFYRVKK